MISFKQYLLEQFGPGNYVAMGCNPVSIPEELMPTSGKPPKGESHITLMYSKGTDVQESIIRRVCEMVGLDHDLNPTHFACFDSIPKEGERDENLATLVLKVENPTLTKLHESLASLGCTHSYPEFSPHVSVAYMVDREECYQVMDTLNAWLSNQKAEGFNPIQLRTNDLWVKPINEDWAKSL